MKRFFAKKIELSPLWRGLTGLGLSLFILLVCLVLQPGAVLNTLKNFLHAPLLFLLNLFPIVAVLGLLTALLGNLFWAGSLTALVFQLLSLTNLIKVECRKDPLVPQDFALLGEAMVATGEYQLDLHLPYLVAILLFSLALLVLGFKLKTTRRPGQRVLQGGFYLTLAVCAMLTVYPSPELYTRMVGTVQGLSTSNVPAVFDETGFIYCFLHNYRLYEVQKPQGYDRAEAAAWASGGEAAEPLPVDVIMIQCEAFSDLFRAEIFDYAAEENPLYLYDLVAASDQAISGRIVVSNYGAGTANTEFDILTGVQTNMLNENSTSAFRVIHKEMASLARVFGAGGSELWFMHPGQSWFYNRESVYHHFGFSQLSFLEAFRGEYRWKGAYIADEGFEKLLLERYEAHRAATEAPWFAFTVTIQNHQAYPWTKYPERPPEAPLKSQVSDETLETISVYAEGVRDGARLLWELTEHFDREDRPVLLVFWGDHLPAMGKNFSVYRELGLEIGNEADLSAALDTYTTPFVIWANRAYCQRWDFESRAAALELPTGGRISDTYLGELVYELCGLTGTDPYWDYLGQARRVLPVISLGRYELPDGTRTEELTPELEALVDKLRKWGYYRVMDERITQ